MPAPRVSAVLVNFRTARHVAPCLAALALAAGELPLEVVVVDSASPDRGPARAAALGFRDDVIFIEREQNEGFAVAANAGAARARAPLILFINPDARPGPGALATLVAALESRPDAAAVGPRLVDGRGRPQIGDAGPHPTVAGAWRYALGATSALFAGRDLGREPVAVGWLSGAFLLVRAASFRRAGGFDGSFFLFGEDVDLGRRLTTPGETAWLIPTVAVAHEGGASYRRSREPSPLEGRWARGLCQAHARGGAGALARASFTVALGVGLLTRALGHALGLGATELDRREGRARARSLGRALRACLTPIS